VNDWITTEELIAAVERRTGRRLTRDALKGWGVAGLIPRADQDHPPGVRGSRPRFSAGVLERVIAICELQMRPGFKKRLDRVAFELWWTGRELEDRRLVRAVLRDVFGPMLSDARELRDRYDDPAEAALAIPLKLNSRLWRTLRRHAKGRKNLDTALRAAFEELFGGDAFGEEHIEKGDTPRAELLERTLGVDRARTARILETPDTPTDEPDDLASFARGIVSMGIIDLDHPTDAIDQASDEELDVACDIARAVLDALLGRLTVVQLAYGDDYGGASAMRDLFTAYPTDARALFIQLALFMRRQESPEDRIHNQVVLERIVARLPEANCRALFAGEYPGYAFIMQPDADAQLSGLPLAERSLIDQAIKRFQEAHPECADTFIGPTQIQLL